MQKISDALKDIIRENTFFEFGLSNRILNLSQLAKFLQPLIESRLHRETQTSAIVMSLSRLQKNFEKNYPMKGDFEIENISIQSHLATLTFEKTPEIYEKINIAHNAIQKQNEYFLISESTSEITIMVDKKLAPTIAKIVENKPKYQNNNISSICVKFNENYSNIPGILYALMQKLTLQNINLIEIASTYTEFIFFVDNEDVYLSFETLHACFSKK